MSGSRRLRVVGWLLVVSGVTLVVAAIARVQVDVPIFVSGLAILSCGAALAVGDWDVLRDHPDEGAERDEERRRRGAAGWQKPVSPPPPGSRPGGLPPRKGR